MRRVSGQVPPRTRVLQDGIPRRVCIDGPADGRGFKNQFLRRESP